MSERIHMPRSREPEAPAPVDELLALQRGLGNQAVGRLLRVPATQLGSKPVTQLDDKGWADKVRANGHIELYAEIATLLQATNLADVKGTREEDINGARRVGYGDLKPGLNFVRNLGARGRTVFLSDGQATSKLTDAATGEEPAVAVILSEHAFDPDNKAFTLGVLRHELEHAVHNRMAANLLKSWRAGSKAKPFRNWLRDQSLNAADRALVYERLQGAVSGTEALANLEGLMAAFTVERPGLGLADEPATEELGDVASFYVNAPTDVRTEVRARLTAYAAGLKGERRGTFLAKLKELRAAKPGIADLADPILKRP